MKLADDRVRSEVFSSLEKGTLPQSILFTGPRYSGRLSTALDLCYRIAGKEGRNLLEPMDIVYFPARDMSLEVRSEYNILSERLCDRQRNNFISKVRLTLMQYHPSLQKDAGSKGKFFEQAGNIGEQIYQLLETPTDNKKEFLKLAGKIAEDAARPDFAFKGKKKGGISVDEVRAVQNFVSLGEEEKFVIIENIEDSMEASKNALLKILEEPPKGAHFILISENPQRIMQTILSRVRRFTFPSVGNDKLNECLMEWYQEFSKHASFKEFIYEMSVPDEEREKVRDASSRFYDYLKSGRVPEAPVLNEIFAPLDRGRDYFISLLTERIEEGWKTKAVTARRAQKLNALIKEAVLSSDVYNQNLKNALDLALREASRVD